jgi:hypothetical protein
MKRGACSEPAADGEIAALADFCRRFYPYVFACVCAPHALAGLLYTAAPQDVRVLVPATSHAAVLLGGCVDILALHN